MTRVQDPMMIGEGKHRYAVEDLWGRMPERRVLGTTHGVVEDRQGRILIHHVGSPSVVIFDAQGNYLDAWGEAYAQGAHGMFYHAEAEGEFLYLAATNQHIVAKVTLAGEEVLRIGTPPRPDIYSDEKPFVPTECAVTSDNRIFIADGYGQPWVHEFNQAGDYVNSFGGPGSEAGQMDQPHGIEIDARSGRELLLVADRRNHRLQWFTPDGEAVRMKTGDLRFPCTAMVHGSEVYIPDLYSRLTVLDAEDKLVLHLGDRPDCWKQEGWPNLPPSEWVVGAFSSPHDLHVDRAGNIYVAEWLSKGPGKLTKLVRQ